MTNNDKSKIAENNQTEAPLPLWKRPWFRNSLTVLLFIAAFLIIRPIMQGDVIQGQAPQMQVQSITGKAIDLQALNQQGQPVLVHIWATWCPICSATKGGIESVAESYPVINIATQSASDQELLAYAKENEMNPDIIVNDQEGRWMQVFGAKAVPADFVIAPNGEIAFVEVGFTTGFGLKLRLWWSQFMSESK